MEGKIHFAIAGHGNIGKRHARMVRENPDAVLSALIDTNPLQIQGIPDADAVPYYDSLEAFLKADTITDVVVVATPNGLHAEHALQCLDARKHVVIEKPLSLSKVDAERVIFKALHIHKHVFVVMQNRYSPPAVWLKEMIATGRLGKIFMVTTVCHWNRDDRYYSPGNWHGTSSLDGGTLFTQFSHFIDLIYWLFGEIKDIKGRFANFNHEHLTEFEDCGVVNFEFMNGGMGSLNFSTLAWDKNMESTMTVIGEFGTVKIGGQYMDEVSYCHVKDYEMPNLSATNPGNDYGAYKGSASNHQYVIDNVINVLQGREAIATNALEGLKVVEIIERIYAAKSTNSLLNHYHATSKNYQE